jgi:hypothetical protein
MNYCRTYLTDQIRRIVLGKLIFSRVVNEFRDFQETGNGITAVNKILQELDELSQKTNTKLL